MFRYLIKGSMIVKKMQHWIYLSVFFMQLVQIVLLVRDFLKSQIGTTLLIKEILIKN